MAQKRRGGSGGMFMTLVWCFCIASLIVAWFKSPVTTPTDNVFEWGQAKSAAVEQWVKSWTDGGLKFPSGTPGMGGDSTNGSTTPNSSDVPLSESQTSLNALTVANAATVNYNRDEWKHWNTVRTCWDTREEVLVRDAVPGSVTYLNSSKQDISSAGGACYVKSGKWIDRFSGKTITDPSTIDIDHMIPLSYTAQHGGQAWDAKKKSDYANSLEPGHLVAVSASENRAKGDKGPSQWKPSNPASHCQYATDWVRVASKWSISITDADKQALSGMLATCK